MLIVSVLPVSAIETKIVDNARDFSEQVCRDIPAMYVFDGNCRLDKNVSLAAGTILKFEGGMISGNGNISGAWLIIDAPKYRIFGDGVTLDGIGNGEISAHWFGAVGDGVNDDAPAINRALKCAGTSWVTLENLSYRTDNTIILNKSGQRFRCPGMILYSGSGAAVELKNTFLELDINELRQLHGSSPTQRAPFKGSGILFSWNVYNATINVNKIRYFKYGLNLSPKLIGEWYSGIQYCKISWQYITGEYGIYFDMPPGAVNAKKGDRIWVNENQFNGGRLQCYYGIYSTPVDDKYKDIIGLINGNVFNCIGIEGEGSMQTKAITLHNAWHNKFNDIRLSEGYLPVGETWIELSQCGYLDFTFKSQIPYSSVKATRCNHIKIDGAICDDGLGYYMEYDRLYLLNGNPQYNPLGTESAKNAATYKFVTRDIVPSSEFKSIYLGATADAPNNSKTQNIRFEDLFYSRKDGIKVLSDKCFITVNDNSTLNISTVNAIPNPYLDFKMVCKISSGSKIVITNADGRKMTLTMSGVYNVRPLDSGFELYLEKETKNNIYRFE